MSITLYAPSCCVSSAEANFQINRNVQHFTHKKIVTPLLNGHYILLNFGKITRPVLVDTGASISLVNWELLKSINGALISKISPSKIPSVKLLDGNFSPVIGQINLSFYLDHNKLTFEFQVLPEMNFSAILGLDFFHKFHCTIDYSSQDFITQMPTIGATVGACELTQDPRQYPPDTLVCDAPTEPQDMAYYQKAAIPKFSNYEDEQVYFPLKTHPRKLPPVPLDLSKSVFSDKEKDSFRKLIKKYRHAFAVDDTELGRTHLYVHKLRLKPNAQPPRTKLYQTNPAEREIIKTHILDMLSNGVIKPVSEGIYSSPTLLVPKKDGTLRFVADLRDMNKILEEDTYPLPLIRDVLDALGASKASVYSIVDLRSAFWQIEVHPSSQKYLTINTYMGRYAFRVLPFGLHSSPSAFQRLMNTVLRGILWDYAIPFLDDVVVYSENVADHLKHLEEIFCRLQNAGLKLKPQKCQFGLSQIQYLGHNIGRKGLAPFSEKVRAVREFPTPTSISKVKSFLGLANYYRKFIKDFSRLAKPLNDLTKKAKSFIWTEAAQNSFTELKRRLITAPILSHADPKLPYRLTTDASKAGLGWVLEQKQEGKYRVICYGGKSLTPAQSNYGISDLEALAVITAIKDLDCYLRHQKFTILTDHLPLKYMLTNQNPPPGRWSRWIDKGDELPKSVHNRRRWTRKGPGTR